jgi:hypothetical protein
MRKIRFKKITIDWKQFFNYVFLIILSSSILLSFLIALPLTERLTDVVAFDLNVANEYWSKEYIIDLQSEEVSNIRKTKNILFKRLNNYNVEEVSITNTQDVITVVVKTTQPQTYVDELIRNPYQYSIVTRKEDIDFDDEENQLAPYLAENYNNTQFDTKTFRSIHVTQLPSSSGEDSYFGIAKPWPHKAPEFKNFLEKYQGEYVGVNIDGFVTPIFVTEETNTVFAIPLNADKTGVEAIDILYNSGTIPTTYEVTAQNPIDVEQSRINYIEVTIALFISILAIYLYTYFTGIYDKDMVLRTLFTTLFALSLYLTFLKITLLPVHVFLLIIVAVLIIMLTKLIGQNHESRSSLLITGVIFSVVFNLLGIGYLKILGGHLLAITAISYLAVLIGNLYVNKVSEYFKK